MLAARGASGTFDLWQARGSDACLCVGSGDCMPEGCHTKLEIQPGHFKYGWYADPQRFTAALSDSITNAAASAAQKAMEGITIAPARSSPLDLRRESSGSGADASSQSWYMSRTASTALTVPITISGRETSSASLASSMYTETMEGSIISDSSMMTTRTNKTRRGKRGGKKQRENSQLRKQQSLPQSPTMVSPTSSLLFVAVYMSCHLRHHCACMQSPDHACNPQSMHAIPRPCMQACQLLEFGMRRTALLVC